MSAQREPLTPKRLAVLAAGLLILTGLSIWRLGQSPVPDIAAFTGETMGTTYSVKVALPDAGAPDPRAIQEAIEVVLARVNQGMSTYIEDSEISRFNRAEAETPFVFGWETFERFETALLISEQTGGAFDITVGPIVNAYGFGPETVTNSPNDAELDALRERVGYSLLGLDREARSVSKARGDVYCDLSAIAKGYGVDAVADRLTEMGMHHYFIEIGGEVRAAGAKPDGEPWRAGIERPEAEGRVLQRIVPLAGRSLATSGDYRNYFEEDGRRISHTIDPRTGRPIDHSLASVSVLHERCEVADAYATALMVLGPDAGPDFAEMHGLAALFLIRAVEGEFVERESTAFRRYLDAQSTSKEI